MEIKILNLELIENIFAFLSESFEIQEITSNSSSILKIKKQNTYRDTVHLSLDYAFVDLFENGAIFYSEFIPETLILFPKESITNFTFTFSFDTIYRFLKLFHNPQVPNGVMIFLDLIYYYHNYCNNIHDFKFNYYYKDMTDNMKKLAIHYEEKRKEIFN